MVQFVLTGFHLHYATRAHHVRASVDYYLFALANLHTHTQIYTHTLVTEHGKVCGEHCLGHAIFQFA